jgi:hypothetical protein
MFGAAPLSGLQKTTSYKVVLPFYVYAAFAFLLSCLLLLLNTGIIGQHHFHPRTLAITHLMALGWGTMIILGASHQLVPVLIEGQLESERLAMLSFVLAGLGIPLLVLGFYAFRLDWLPQTGGVLINLGVICFLVNVLGSVRNSKTPDVHAWFIAAAALWLFSTTFLGLLLLFNFSRMLLPENSVAYLTVHAHLGLVGWFLLLVLGVASRLIPMFLISKYTNRRRLWWIFSLVNGSLVCFLLFRLFGLRGMWNYVPWLLCLAGVLLFGSYCRAAFQARIRKKVDEQMKISLLAVAQMLLPLLALGVVLACLPAERHSELVMLYGFCIFFGWLTALILGMTFKTLPFIVWNKVYHDKAHSSSAPAPKELFSERIFTLMSASYITGFVLFIPGVLSQSELLAKAGAALLLLAAALYVTNVGITLRHKPKL